MKFYDRLMADHAVVETFAPNTSHLWRCGMEDAVVIDASNVVKHCSETGWSLRQAPSLLPPFTHSWWETSYIPTEWRPDVTSFGALAFVEDWRGRDQSEALSFFNGLAPQVSDDSPRIHPIGPETTVREAISWLVHWTAIMRVRGRIVPLPIQTCTFALDATGSHVESEDGAVLVSGVCRRGWYKDSLSPEEGHNAIGKTYGTIKGFLMAVGFCHCKNVELIDGDLPEPKLRKKQEQKIGGPITQFKELVIDPNLTRKQSVTRTTHVGPKTKVSLHICRGHFATYSEDRPLFGKYAGTFWVPAHVRGTEQAGKVFKDYAIKA